SNEAEKVYENTSREAATQSASLLESAEKLAEKPSATNDELDAALGDFKRAARLASVNKEVTSTGFRAGLGAPRTAARLGEAGVPDRGGVRERGRQGESWRGGRDAAAVRPLDRARLVVLSGLNAKKDEPQDPLAAVRALRDLKFGADGDPKALIKALGGN